jgi:hypothetical protein
LSNPATTIGVRYVRGCDPDRSIEPETGDQRLKKTVFVLKSVKITSCELDRANFVKQNCPEAGLGGENWIFFQNRKRR